MTWELRPARAEDAHLIKATYVRGARRAMWPTELEGRDWPALADRFVAACLESGHCMVAGWPGSDVVGGYLLGERRAESAVVHWAWTKGIYRRRGIAARLLGALARDRDDVVVTHTATRWQRDRVRAMGWRAADRLPWLWLLEYEARRAG